MFDEELEEFESALRFENGMSGNTCVSYMADVVSFAEHLKSRGASSLSEASRRDVADYLAGETKRGMSPATRRRRTAAIRRLFRFLAERRRTKEDPSALVAAAKKGLSLPKVLSEEEVARMIEGVSGKTPRDLRDRAMLEVMYGSGLRVSETCALRVEDFAADGELLRLHVSGIGDIVQEALPLDAVRDAPKDVFAEISSIGAARALSRRSLM
jgi:site-specific recombinase XerD